jgi:hypothetical protein
VLTPPLWLTPITGPPPRRCGLRQSMPR